MSDFSLRVGIDISAQQVSATWGITPDEHRPVVEVEQSTKGYQQLIHQLHQTGNDPAHCQVVMEATGTYWMRLAYTLHDAGFSVSVINPVQAHRLAQAQLRRAKTDAIDAQLLMELGFKLEPLPWTPPPPLYDALYQRLRQRDALLEIRTQERNRLHALQQWPEAQPAVVERYHRHIAFLTEQIETLQTEIEQLLRSDSDWAAATHSLLSIPGIGPITTAWLMVATLNFTTCQTVEQLVAFAGLAPYPRQSGTSLHRTRGVGSGGYIRLRAALYMAAIASVRSNPIIRRFYTRLRERGKPAKVALCACARKLLLLAWAVVTKHQPFDPDFGKRIVCPV
ncbi:MAG: transposase [Chloroflexi bacterium]|nr:transposase [Chloroflexota bacterium]